MTPERYAKLQAHHKAGAYAVATLADVDGLRAQLEEVRRERDGWAEQAPKTSDMLLGAVAEQRARAERAEAALSAVAEAVRTACRPWGGTGMDSLDLPAIITRALKDER